jgi:hypothetical protein
MKDWMEKCLSGGAPEGKGYKRQGGAEEEDSEL